jgi:acetolactate synthase I/II/III large subunit
MEAISSLDRNAPFLMIILNNRGWRAPKGSTLAFVPEWSSEADDIHCSIHPPPDYVRIATAAGDALCIKVGKPDEIIPALDRALKALRLEHQALLDVRLAKF